MLGRRAVVGVLALAFVIPLVACSASGSTAAAKNIDVTLSDKDIMLSATEIPAGAVTFTVMNKGTIVHSIVVLRTDLSHEKIPTDTSDPSKVQEPGSIAATGQMAVGTTKQITRQLTAGHYVIVCNEPAHYAVGMHTGLQVK